MRAPYLSVHMPKKIPLNSVNNNKHAKGVFYAFNLGMVPTADKPRFIFYIIEN